MSHRIRTNFLVTGELVCWSTREVGTAKPRSQKRFDLANTAIHKHNSGVRALASKVIHRFARDEPGSSGLGQSQVMHPLRRIVFTRAMAVAMLSLAMWQQQNAPVSATDTVATGSDQSTESDQAQVSWQASWQVPLQAPVHLINPYRQPNSDYSAGHRGIDYRVFDGQTVFAPTDSKVWFVGKVVDRSVLTLRTDSGDLVSFEPVCSELRPADRVKNGQPIGAVCAADKSYRQHCDGQLCLHFSLRGPAGYLSPIVRIGGYSPTVLLPLKD